MAVANAMSSLSPGLQTGASFTVEPGAEEPACSNGEDDDDNGLTDAADPGCWNNPTDSTTYNANDDSEFPGAAGDGVPECQNGTDDDDDGAIDFSYPNPPGTDDSCVTANDASELNSGPQAPECSTAADDDGDGDGGTNANDPECVSPNDNDEFFLEECADGENNDAEGGVDMADPGCAFPYDDDESSNNPPVPPGPQCSNGFDDDANGLVDSADPGCTGSQDDSEEPGLGFGGVPECQNLEDDDEDGKVDFTYPNPPGADPKCDSATDADEFVDGVQAPECSTPADDDDVGDGGTHAAGDPECTHPADDDEDYLEECSDGEDNDDDGSVDEAAGCTYPYDDDEGSENVFVDESDHQAAVSDTPLAGFPREGSTFAILSSGDAEAADDPNASGATSGGNGGSGYGEANDPITLKVDINVPAGNNCLSFDFRFLSEEFPEYLNAGYNDAFVAELDSQALNVTGSTITSNDFAGGTGDQISVDGAGPSGMSDAFAGGTTYDGATPRLVARHVVDPGPHSIFFTIFDAGDSSYDSAVFLDNLRVNNEANASDCQSLSVEPFQGNSGVAFGGDPANPLDLSSDLAQLIFSLHCNLPAGNELSCQNNYSGTFTPTETETTGAPKRRAATPVPLTSGSATIPAGQTQTITAPVSPEAQAAMDAVRDKPGQLRAQATKLKQKAKKLKKQAKTAPKPKAKKLLKKAKKLLKQAKALEQQATALEAQPLGTVTMTFTNPVNGASDTITVPINE